MYSLPGTGFETIKECERDIRQGHAMQRKAKLGDVGQAYLRAVMLRSEALFGMLQKARIGKLKAANNRRIDMRAYFLAYPDVKVIVEVKNEYEVLPQSDRVFADVIATAIVENAFPIFAAGNISATARPMCEQLGLLVLEFNRHFIPKSLCNDDQDRLYKAFGPQSYELIEAGRSFNYLKLHIDRCRSDIDSFRDIQEVAWLSPVSARIRMFEGGGLFEFFDARSQMRKFAVEIAVCRAVKDGVFRARRLEMGLI